MEVSPLLFRGLLKQFRSMAVSLSDEGCVPF